MNPRRRSMEIATASTAAVKTADATVADSVGHNLVYRVGYPVYVGVVVGL